MTNRILENFEFGDIKEYLFFLESTTPFDNGVFFSFDSESELLNVIREELLSFCHVDEDEIEKAQIKLKELLPNSLNKVDESVLLAMNQLLTQWNVGYIGTVGELMSGNLRAEKWIRSEFRKYHDLDGGDQVIQEDEIDDFKNFLLPEWER